LESQVEEGQVIEPKWYIPVIPLVMVNGADGIGTGWSTSLPNYNPRDIIKQLKRFIKGKPMEKLDPWYKGFQGSIAASESEEKNGYEVVGVAKKSSPTSIEVSELPVRRWTQDYKEFLTKLVDADGEGAKGSRIEDFQEYHTESNVHFTLNMTRTQMKALEDEGLEKALKLRSSLSTNNIVFFDPEGKIKKYNTELELMTEFAELRLKYYQKRKDFHADRLRREKELLDAKVRFILMVIRGELVVSNRKKADLLQDLRSKKFKAYHEIFSKEPAGATSSEGEEKGGAFDYLLGMPIWSLTLERVEKMKEESKHKTQELTNLEKTTIQELGERDLDAILSELKAIDDFEEELRAEDKELKKSAKRGRGKVVTTTRRARRRGEVAPGKDEEDEEEDEPPPPPKRRKEGETKDESSNDFLARLKERQKARGKLEMPTSLKKLRAA
jgi:DNA topoisomerase-2